jgi:hypothetical protein
MVRPLDNKVPEPTWVPDTSKGHWDCPDGYTAVVSNEPGVYGSFTNAAIYIAPTLDAKKHVLFDRPANRGCVPDKGSE